jgi:formylglycine-generating enzyme required for sulfatase activity
VALSPGCTISAPSGVTRRCPPYVIDRTPVTNAQFGAFLNACGYRPRFAENFLRHWKG